MTQAKAQSVASALIGANYRIDECTVDAAGNWFIKAYATSPVDSATINTFATNQGVTATSEVIKFV